MKTTRVFSTRTNVIIAFLFVAALAVAGVVAPVQKALALPPGGAGSNTPGTSSSISPTTVRPGEQITFKVSGYPAGETVHVKIDDGTGQGYDTSEQGTGVVATAQIDSSGNATGTVTVPATLANGQHWLRFLASQAFTDSKGENVSKGFTNKSPYFTVTNSSGTQTGQDTTSTQQAAPEAGEVQSAAPGDSEDSGVSADLTTGTADGSGVVETKATLSSSMSDGVYTIRATQGANEADAVIAVGDAQLPTTAAASSSGPALTVNGESAAKVKAGDEVTLKATGFDPNEKVTFSLLTGSANEKTVVQEEDSHSGIATWVIIVFIVVVVLAALALFFMLRSRNKNQAQQVAPAASAPATDPNTSTTPSQTGTDNAAQADSAQVNPDSSGTNA